MGKGELTRAAVIEHALTTAAKVGFEQLSLATLAADAGMSKSGLYAHFKSKEALQQAVLELAIDRFTTTVIYPALRQRRGRPRLQALFDGYMTWLGAQGTQGRCLFMSLAQEFRDRPGAIRDLLVQAMKDWQGTIVRVVGDAIEEGELSSSEDPRQLAFEIIGIGMSFHNSFKLLGRSDAETMARRAFAALLARSGSEVAPR